MGEIVVFSKPQCPHCVEAKTLLSELDIPFTDSNGQERSGKISRFQGFGRPTKPLSDLTWSDRERV